MPSPTPDLSVNRIARQPGWRVFFTPRDPAADHLEYWAREFGNGDFRAAASAP